MGESKTCKYDCVIFDLDGTLLDTRAAMHAALDAVMADVAPARVAAPMPADTLHLGLGAMLRRALAAANLPSSGPDFARMERKFAALYLAAPEKHVRPFPNLRSLLETLRARGVWIAVCSNQTERSARRLLASFGLCRFFRHVVGNDTLAACKPDPMPLIWLMGQARRGPGTTLMVGDSDVDAVAAERAGCDCVILEHGYGAADAGPRHPRLADLAALAKLLVPS